MAAKEYYEDAFVRLGKLYLEGIFVKKDYAKAKKYFENNIVNNNPDALYYLGKIYYEGLGVTPDFQKALKCFELSTQNDGIKALFYMGLIYENGQGVDVDKQKAIECYKKCVENNDEIIITFNRNYWNEKIQKNENYYLSNNNISLMFILENNNLQLAEKYLKIAVFSELSHAQNNYGLVGQFIHKNIMNSDYWYDRASKQKFAISEFIFGHEKDSEKKYDDAIKHYLLAIQYECEPLKSWINNFIFDKRLDISKIFLIFFANLKLTLYNVDVKYFINCIFRPVIKLLLENNDKSFYFNWEIIKNGGESIMTNLHKFIFGFLLFDMQNLTKINSNCGWNEFEDQEFKTVMIDFKYKGNDLDNKKSEGNEYSNTNKENLHIFLSEEVQNIINYYKNYYEFKKIE
ncbi:hypothetical protein M9Y10_041867 [Tritrichomonas musculus]|uniref:Uncharacterized protein n=1 Tax=Tritrichomonas musculus TaxID=1915356 RepID=A0ABR2K5R5_9EUKA